MTPILHLASSSPRRQEILRRLGIRFSMSSPSIDEARIDDEAPLEMVLRLAAAKSTSAAPADGRLVLGADTAVILEDRVFGKPRDADSAIEMLLQLSARQHSVITAVALTSPTRTRVTHSSTKVRFREIGRDEAVRYWQSGEPCDKAGGYGIQGLGGLFVEAIEGSYSGVMGLPVFETAGLLKRAGVDVLQQTI